MKLNPLAALLLLGLAAGCVPESRSYSIVLKNDTPVPLTVWPVKAGGPFEANWAAPEDLAIEAPRIPDVATPPTVPAGRTLEAGPLNGKFDAGSGAVLRVYEGALNYHQVLAVSPGGKYRFDVPLRPGENRLVAERTPSGLVVRREQP